MADRASVLLPQSPVSVHPIPYPHRYIPKTPESLASTRPPLEPILVKINLLNTFFIIPVLFIRIAKVQQPCFNPVSESLWFHDFSPPPGPHSQVSKSDTIAISNLAYQSRKGCFANINENRTLLENTLNEIEISYLTGLTYDFLSNLTKESDMAVHHNTLFFRHM